MYVAPVMFLLDNTAINNKVYNKAIVKTALQVTGAAPPQLPD